MVDRFQEMQIFKTKSYYFKILKTNYYEERSSTLRYQLYAVFSAWKMHAREKALLKKYLRESNMPENLAYTPITEEKPKSSGRGPPSSIGNRSSLSNTQYSGMSGGEFNRTRTGSAIKIERDLMVSSFKNF
jgi:hypothetical protein